VVAVEEGAGDVEEFVGVGVEVGGERAAAVDAEGQAEIGGVVAARQVPSSCRSVMPLARTVQPSGAVTVRSKAALRSGWSKAAKTRWTSSMKSWV
jgi:hypothetical protein